MPSPNIAPNFLQNIQFRIAVKRLPYASFFLQKMQLPDLSLGFANQPTPFEPVKRNGDRLVFNDVTMNFICDEHMNTYTEIFNWMVALTHPVPYKEMHSEDPPGLYSDISVILLSGSKKPVAEYVFHKCFPSSLSNVSLDSTVMDNQPTEMTVTFSYDTFEIRAPSKKLLRDG